MSHIVTLLLWHTPPRGLGSGTGCTVVCHDRGQQANQGTDSYLPDTANRHEKHDIALATQQFGANIFAPVICPRRVQTEDDEYALTHLPEPKN